MVVFPSPCSAFASLVDVVLKSSFVPEKRTANIRRMTIGSPMLAMKRAPADHGTETFRLGPTLGNIRIWHFTMGGILWLYQTQGLFIICAPDTDVIDDSHRDCSLTAGHKKHQSLNFVKFHWLTLMIYFITGICINFRHSCDIFLFCIYCLILKYFR